MPIPESTGKLAGLRVLVTRPAGQETGLMELIRQTGGRPLHFPALEIQPLQRPVLPGSQPDILIFISANAVTHGLLLLQIPEHTQVAAVGKATAAALRSRGVNVDIIPPSPYTTEGLLAQPAFQSVVGKNITIVRGVGGRELLRTELEHRGSVVNYLECYQRCQPDRDASAELVKQGKAAFDVTVCTSAESLLNLKHMFHGEHENLLLSLPVVVVSDRMHREAQKAGYKKVVQAKDATPEAIVKALDGRY